MKQLKDKSKRNCNTSRMGSCFERLEAPLTVAFNSVDGYQAGVIQNLCGFSPESVNLNSLPVTAWIITAFHGTDFIWLTAPDFLSS